VKAKTAWQFLQYLQAGTRKN